MIIVQLWDPKAAAAEIERNVARGARAVAMPEQCLGHDLPSYYDPFWDPIWSACQNADIPICMHIGSSGWKAYRPPGSPDILGIALSMVATITHSVGMAFGPVPRKFPRIKLVYAEGGIGWVPVSLERADSRFELHHLWSGTDDLLPSEVFKSAEAARHEKAIVAIVRSWRPELLDQPGVGPIVAATLLCAWPHPGRVHSEAAFAMLAGVAPIPANSGQTTNRFRLNRYGVRQLNRALHSVALSRLRYDKTTQVYAERRIAEGKTPREIKRCLKRYLARDFYRLLKNPPSAA
jgi:hypothetical protein